MGLIPSITGPALKNGLEHRRLFLGSNNVGHDLLGIVLEQRVVVVIQVQFLISIFGILHVLDRIELHNPISQGSDLSSKGLLSFFVGASCVIGPYRLNVDELYE